MPRSSYFRPAIEAMTGYVPGEQPQEDGFVKLNTNENPYPPSPRVIEAIQRAATDRLRLYPDPLATAFREAAAKLLGVEPDWILAGNGCDDILTIATRSFVGAGDLVRFPYPTYILYETLAELQEGAVETVSFAADWRLPYELGSAGERLRLVFLPNPNSPSGTLAAPEEIRDLAGRLDVPLLLDEAYVDFAERDCAALAAELENVIVARTLSKSYSLAGLRFGYCVARPEIVAGLRKVKDSYNCDAISIAAATAALEDQAWMRDNAKKIRATRSRLSEALGGLGFDVPDSQANFVWATHAVEPVRPVFEELRRRKVLVRYMDFPGWGDGLRVTVGTDAEVDRLLEELGPIV